MSWTKESESSSTVSKESQFDTNTYELGDDNETLWDNGLTNWDVSGNVATTQWDKVSVTDTWSKESGV